MDTVELLTKHAPGGGNYRVRPIGPADPDGSSWWLEHNRFGNRNKLRQRITWEDGVPVFGDIEYHIYRQQIHRKRGTYGDVVKGKGIPEYITTVWGQDAMKAALAAAKQQGHRVYQTTTRIDQ